MTRHPLVAAIALALLLPAVAAAAPAAAGSDPQHDRERAKPMQELVVTASPLRQTAEDIARPVEVLAGAELDAAKANTLGETLSRLPGVQSGYFGPGVGRPVIRGMDGARVQVLAGGLSAMDASTVSVDHAVSIEPFLADQIEVMKGPATLLYGSSAIGGAVNVVDGRIPEQAFEGERPFTGRAELRGNTVSDEATGMLRVDGGSGAFAYHLDLFRRHTDDYRIPGFAESAELLAEEGETLDPDESGILPNSAISTRSGAFGASWVGTRGFLGASISRFDTNYGIPAHAEHHDEDDDHAEEDAEAEQVRIDLVQRRVDVKGQLDQPFAGHDALRVQVGRGRYRHVELEGNEIGTEFNTDSVEARLEAVHRPLAGWRGAWGLQYGRRDFSAVGEEAFVPPSLSRDLGLFWLGERAFERSSIELGLRGDQIEVAPEDAARRRFDTFSASLASRFDVGTAAHLQIGIDRSERAPTAEELFSDGPHLATGSFEIGDADLDSEVATRAELGLHWHNARIEARAAVYSTRFDDFIYLAATGDEEDELPVRVWTQADARFDGAEAEARLKLADGAAGAWSLRLFGDTVRARLRDGDDLPRIPATRFGSELQWTHDAWRATLGAVHHARQRRVAEFERPSAAYTLLDAHLAYHWDVGDIGWELFLDGSNLTDREARPHTSFLRDLAPLPGRGVAFGIRAFF
jgi:iron complex outermembrane recepter protein